MITLEEIRQAKNELPPEVVCTPVIRATELSREIGSDIFLKLENFQTTGSYKARAAYTLLNRLSPEQKRRGATISSSGNFAAAFACMGALLDIPTTVVMMKKTAPYKSERTRRFGAEVVFCENRNQARWDMIAQLERERGITAINTFEDPNVSRGHGTLGLEIVEQIPDADIVLIPVSSGGLIAGVATAIKSIRPETRIVGIQPEGSPAMYRSFHTGSLCEVPEPSTVCDALVAARPGQLPFEHVRSYVDDMILVSDEEAISAVCVLAEGAKCVAEPGGAVGIAAIRAGKIDVQGKRVVVLISGGNIDPHQFGGYLAR
ncbi:MAG: threonine/serine dehydratase [candidate division Zixibacteria bacterium]|nr:threonine/serine dehydratase [candidate division Zixibacteria bacterium]